VGKHREPTVLIDLDNCLVEQETDPPEHLF